jgi:hypothetical protein
MTATEEQCRKVNAIERDKALAWVDRNIKVPLTEPQKWVLHPSARTTLAPVNASIDILPSHQRW